MEVQTNCGKDPENLQHKWGEAGQGDSPSWHLMGQDPHSQGHPKPPAGKAGAEGPGAPLEETQSWREASPHTCALCTHPPRNPFRRLAWNYNNYAGGKGETQRAQVHLIR